MIVFIAIASAFFGLAGPFFQKEFVDRMLGSESVRTRFGDARFLFEWMDTAHPLMPIVIAFVCALLAQGLSLVGNYVGLREGILLQKHFGERLYRKMLSIRSDVMGSTTVGEVVSIFATDVAGSTALVDQVLAMAAGIIFPLVFAPLAIYWITGIPAWATIGVMSVIVLMNVVMGIRQSRFFYKFKMLAAERTGLVNEWVQNIRLLRILGWVESFESKIFRKREEETRNRVAMVTNGQLMGTFGSSINFFINITGVATLVYASGRVPTPGELFALLWIFGVFLSRPFRQIPWIFTWGLDSLSSMRRLERFLSKPSDVRLPFEIKAEDEKREPTRTSRELVVRGLNLVINDQPVLAGIDLDIKAGEFVAVVGEVGSGKSLLVLSLVGETGATFETFSIGDVDVLRDLDLDARRKRFAFVPQEGFVMSASLRENIAFRYDVASVDDPEIVESLSLAQFRLGEEHLTHGLETEIGERGVNLSGGQRQRVSLARSRYFDRPIVLLDDCLSAVDVDTERRLLEELIDGEWKNKTRILVTHRLSVLTEVDRILFMEDGQLVDSGTFAELMTRSAKMRTFVQSVIKSEAGSPGAELASEPVEDGERGADVDAESVS